jgi:hypothetical protein
MGSDAKWALAGLGALIVIPIAALYLRDKGQPSPQPTVAAAPTPSAPPPAPTPTVAPPIPETNGPSCRLDDGPCVEDLSAWAADCGKKGNDKAKASPDACSRVGAFGMCRVGGGYIGKRFFFYRTTQIADQAAARATCEGTFHGTFLPIGIVSANTPTPTTAPTFKDISPEEVKKIEKAAENFNEALKKK